jgi:hypothetical protein
MCTPTAQRLHRSNGFLQPKVVLIESSIGETDSVTIVLELIGRIAAGVVGTWIVVSTFTSAVKTVILPRGGSSRLSRILFVSLRHMFEFVAHPGRSFADRDRILSFWAPIGLISLPFVWSAAMTIGYTGVHWAVSGGAIGDAFTLSGSSWFTLGAIFDRATISSVLSFVQAAMGIVLTALLVSYLPSIYASYQRRETLVGLLESRAGMPPRPAELLTRYQRIDAIDLLDDDLFSKWEQWFVEVEESQLSHPALMFFRSPRPDRSWITAAGCVLDCAAIKLSCLDVPFSGRTALCLRSGFLALRRLADYFSVPVDHDPAPTDPISVTRSEFDTMIVELRAMGVNLRSDEDRMWADFVGWRVNYDKALVGLAKLVIAPDAVWSSDRPGARYVPTVGLIRPGSRVHRGGRLR